VWGVVTNPDQRTPPLSVLVGIDLADPEIRVISDLCIYLPRLRQALLFKNYGLLCCLRIALEIVTRDQGSEKPNCYPKCWIVCNQMTARILESSCATCGMCRYKYYNSHSPQDKPLLNKTGRNVVKLGLRWTCVIRYTVG
jgi:hypothetical protein